LWSKSSVELLGRYAARRLVSWGCSNDSTTMKTAKSLMWRMNRSKVVRIGLANGRELEVYENDMRVLYYRQCNERDNEK
jgi:hypothetical protein